MAALWVPLQFVVFQRELFSSGMPDAHPKTWPTSEANLAVENRQALGGRRWRASSMM